MAPVKKIDNFILLAGIFLGFIFSFSARAVNTSAAYEALEISPEAGDGKNISLTIPAEDREKWAKLIEPLDEKQSKLLRNTGKIAAETFYSAVIFYVGMGLSEGWKCFSTKDPNYCRTYIEGLKEINGHMGLLLFMGASKASAWIMAKTLNASARVASYSGLAIGSLAQDVFSSVSHNPHFEAYWDAGHMKDPKEREKKQKEELKKLYDDTVGSADWYSSKVPTIAALLGATAAAETLGYGREFLWNKSKAYRAKKQKPDCQQMMANLAVETTEPGFLLRRGIELYGVLSFLAWNGLLQPPAEAAWNAITFDVNLKETRKKMQSKQAIEQAEAEKLLKVSEKLWDQARRKEMNSVEEIMKLHKAEMKAFDATVKKPGLFYSWFATGMKEDAAWQVIRELYYKPYTTPEEAKDDIAKYLKSFFCGSDARAPESYANTKDVHGLPVLWKMYVKASSYYIDDRRNTSLCSKNTTSEEFKAELRKKNYENDVRDRKSVFLARTTNDRQDKIDFYEKLVDKKIVKILKEKVLPKFEQERKDLKALRAAQTDPAVIALVGKRMAELVSKKKSAIELLEYMKTPMAKREAPVDDIADLLGLFNNDEEPEWQKISRYYNSFILK